MNKYYELRLLGVFIVLLLGYLLIAQTVLAPLGYYGTRELPRFADPWIARAETIVQGGTLYKDVFTSTPPLMNYLLIPPALFSGWFGHQNPWSTLSFMVYFSLFNLFTAYALLHTAEERETGYRWALYFLLNPLTFGNTVLRRQDESVLVFFFALALLFVIHHRHRWASFVAGLSLLVKLTGGMLIPVMFFETWNWRYLVIPFVVFGLIFLPFYLAAGESAVFWDIGQEHTEHPFQFGGISLGTLWTRGHGGGGEEILRAYSVLFVLGVFFVLALLSWRPLGVWEDLTVLVTTVLLLTPKLHCGYFSILVLAMTPLLRRYRLAPAYFIMAPLALVADMYKWPVENFQLAFWLMVVVCLILVVVIVQVRQFRDTALTSEPLRLLEDI